MHERDILVLQGLHVPYDPRLRVMRIENRMLQVGRGTTERRRAQVLALDESTVDDLLDARVAREYFEQVVHILGFRRLVQGHTDAVVSVVPVIESIFF